MDELFLKFRDKVWKDISLDDLLKRKKVYPQGEKLFWDVIYNDWWKKHKKRYQKITHKEKEKVTFKFRNGIIERFNKLVFEDLVYNHVILEMPYKQLYFFVAQVPKLNDRHYNIDFNTGMYRVVVHIYFRDTIKTESLHKQKYLKLRGSNYNLIKNAIKDGHRYPRYEEVVKFIESKF